MRGSNKHGPHLDEQLKREVESITRGSPVDSRVEEHRLIEDTDPDAPDSTLEAVEIPRRRVGEGTAAETEVPATATRPDAQKR